MKCPWCEHADTDVGALTEHMAEHHSELRGLDERQRGVVREMLDELLGCEWGRAVATPDDPEPCSAQAVQMMCLHGAPQPGDEMVLKLCERHRDRVRAETDPRSV